MQSFPPTDRAAGGPTKTRVFFRNSSLEICFDPSLFPGRWESVHSDFVPRKFSGNNRAALQCSVSKTSRKTNFISRIYYNTKELCKLYYYYLEFIIHIYVAAKARPNNKMTKLADPRDVVTKT
jgi:hypothetical protein